MTRVVAIIAQGAMGAGIARRLTENGVTVLTSLEGRSDASARRAEAARMQPVDLPAIAAADIILSIVPLAEGLALAQRLSPHLDGAEPIYADCNAVSPETAQRIGAVFRNRDVAFVDAGIIGGPPRPDGYTRCSTSRDRRPDACCRSATTASTSRSRRDRSAPPPR